MNTKLLLLLALFFAFAAILASCEFLPEGLFPGAATTTGSDTATTTNPVTTTTVTTTVVTTTAVPNPIASASIVPDGLRIKYKNGKSHILGKAELYDGGNSAVLVDYALDAEGVLSLTFRDAAAYTTANRMLGNTFRDVTLRLREANGNLEWATANGTAFTVLCPAKQNSRDTDPLTKLIDAADLFAHTESLGTGMILSIQGNNLRFRATEWLNGLDFCTDAFYTRTGDTARKAGNRHFNLSCMRVINESLPIDDMSEGTTWKDASDDITPLNFNGTYIGANHGYNLIAKIPNTNKTENDIGSVWKTATGQKFCLVRIADGMLWMCPFDDDSMQDGNFTEYCAKVLLHAGDVLTHDSGAANKAIIPVSADNNPNDMQLHVAVNNVKRHAFLNGIKEVDLLTDGAYEAEFIDFYESYDVIYLPAMLNYLIENAGDNNGESHHDDAIAASYVTISNTYRFHKNGSVVVYCNYDFHKDIPTVSIVGGVQSQPFATATPHVYVPGTSSYAVPTAQATGQIVYIGTKDLANPNRLVTSYFQMTDSLGTKAMNLGYCPDYGYGIEESRREYLGNGTDNLAFYFSTYKMYPKLFANTTVAKDTSIGFIAYRVPSQATDGDFTAINWYWVGDDIYLSLHTKGAVAERLVDLPDYMDGMTITGVESSTSFTVSSTTVATDGITVSSTGAGYTIVKLSPAN